MSELEQKKQLILDHIEKHGWMSGDWVTKKSVPYKVIRFNFRFNFRPAGRGTFIIYSVLAKSMKGSNRIIRPHEFYDFQKVSE